MIYAAIYVRDPDTGHRWTMQIIAETLKDVNDYTDSITASGDQVIGICRDESLGSICVLPEDFSY